MAQSIIMITKNKFIKKCLNSKLFILLIGVILISFIYFNCVNVVGSPATSRLTVQVSGVYGLINIMDDSNGDYIGTCPNSISTANCFYDIPYSHSVVLSADHGPVTWGGACDYAQDGGSCSFTMNGDKTASIVFGSIPVGAYNFTVRSNPVNGGLVTKNPNQPSSGNLVTLTAVPNTAARYVFSKWTIPGTTCDGSTLNPCTFSMPASNVIATANFIKTYALITNSNTGGSGSGGGYYTAGASATIIATASTGYAFSSWTFGKPANIAAPNCPYYACVFNMPASDMTATANFDSAYTLSATPRPTGGNIRSCTSSTCANFDNPITIYCGSSYSTCSASIPQNPTSTIYLKANPITGYTFNSWGGACSSFGTNLICSVSMNDNKQVSATFTQNNPTDYILGANINLSNGGTVTGTGSYNAGDTAILLATASSGFHFSSWGSGCSSNGATLGVPFCNVLMNSAKTINVNFAANTNALTTLTLVKNIAAGGTITSNVLGINCGTNCLTASAQQITQGTSITLTATQSYVYSLNWVGCDSNGTDSQGRPFCTVLMNADKQVNANFVACTNRYYRDMDGDGYGDSTKAIDSCSSTLPTGYVVSVGDCNDDATKDPAVCVPSAIDCSNINFGVCARCINPGKAEICGDGVDNNCNNKIDEWMGGNCWNLDAKISVKQSYLDDLCMTCEDGTIEKTYDDGKENFALPGDPLTAEVFISPNLGLPKVVDKNKLYIQIYGRDKTNFLASSPTVHMESPFYVGNPSSCVDVSSSSQVGKKCTLDLNANDILGIKNLELGSGLTIKATYATIINDVSESDCRDNIQGRWCTSFSDTRVLGDFSLGYSHWGVCPTAIQNDCTKGGTKTSCCVKLQTSSGNSLQTYDDVKLIEEYNKIVARSLNSLSNIEKSIREDYSKLGLSLNSNYNPQDEKSYFSFDKNKVDPSYANSINSLSEALDKYHDVWQIKSKKYKFDEGDILAHVAIQLAMCQEPYPKGYGV